MWFVVNRQSKCWFVYIISADNGNYYTGITVDFQRRFVEHLNSTKGAKFFRISNPKSMEYLKSVESRSEASKLEAQIKKLSRTQKIALIKAHIAQTKDLVSTIHE